jgi:hypothetical protein
LGGSPGTVGVESGWGAGVRSDAQSGTGRSGEEVGTRELRLPVIGLGIVICRT